MIRNFLYTFFFIISISNISISQTWHTGAGNQTNNSGSGISYEVYKPTNIVAGNLVVLILTQQRSPGTVNTSSFTPTVTDGFTLIAASNDNVNRTNLVVYGKIATNDEPTMYTGAVSQIGFTPNWKAVVTRITGHNSTTPFGYVNVANSTNAGSINIPSIRIETNNSMLIAIRSVRALTSGETVPTAMESQLLLNGTTNSMNANNSSPGLHIATQANVPISENSGIKSFGWTNLNPVASSSGIMFTINPVPSTTIPIISTISTNFNGYWRSNIQFPSILNNIQPKPDKPEPKREFL